MRAQYVLAILFGLTTVCANAKKPEELILELGELDKIINQVNSEVRTEPWNEDVLKTSSFKHFIFGDHYVDVVTIEYAPYSRLSNLKKSVEVECGRYVDKKEWECLKSLVREVYSPSLASWFRLSEDVDENEAVRFVQEFSEATRLVWKEKDFVTNIQSFSSLTLSMSFTGKNFQISGSHQELGPMTFELPRQIQGPELEMLNASRFFTLCDDLEMEYGSNPCEQDES